MTGTVSTGQRDANWFGGVRRCVAGVLLICLISCLTVLSTPPAGAAAMPAGVQRSTVLGYSRQHRPIVAYELGNPAARFKAVVLGSMHGYYERAGEQVVGSILTSPVSSLIDLWVIPTMNPDGDALGQRGNAAGVDLNRNWPVGWIYIPPTGSKIDSHYSGPSPLSEPETLAMYHFLTALRPNRLVSMHQPLDGVDTTDGGARDIPFRNALANTLQLPLKPLTCFSTCHGSMTRWLTAGQPGAAITVEFPQNVSAAYLSGRAAGGILAALTVGLKSPPPPVTGFLDEISAATGSVRLVGWVLDPQRTSAAGTVSVTVDGRLVRVMVGNVARPDVDRVMRVAGPHGFDFSFWTGPGRHQICVTGHAAGTSSLAHQLGPCRTVIVPPVVFQGIVDVVSARPMAVRIAGWAVDPLHPSSREWVRISIDGRVVAYANTLVVRPDVNRFLHVTGEHGFDVTLHVGQGRHAVSVVTLAIGTPSLPRLLTPTPRAVVVPGR